jgi:gliding motility-associated lipoprotein GldH
MRFLPSILLLFLGLSLSSCDPNRVFEDNLELPDYTWDVKNKLTFDVQVEDTVSYHDLFVNVRHASHYPYANLYLFITITSPQGHVARDTMECVFADASGQWTGDGMGDIWDTQQIWKPGVRFPVAGLYKFEYVHGMRTEQVPFIMDVGLRVARSERQQ